MFIFREPSKGFTLLELILSLSITGFIVAISLGAIRLGTTAQETGHLKTDTSQRLRLIQNQLGQKIKSNYPVFKFQEKNNSQKNPERFLQFNGGNDYLRFVTFSSFELFKAGLRLLLFSIDRSAIMIPDFPDCGCLPI